jgi:aryl carrier-like protein
MLFKRSHAPHFHAFYNGEELIIGLFPIRVIQGNAPARVKGMALEWAAKHQPELVRAWQNCLAARKHAPIAPLQ